ncbi:MAG: Phosphoenolpyruvate carboxylase [Elusimicrobia bacterium]|nr:Phosphoenolpyruvate carboxylase [Elusimicrobiota bacterium]
MSDVHIIPRCMSTQHPDNANIPFFSHGPQLGSEEEVREAFYVYSTLGCDEQMWDHEGKEVDAHVVPKLLSQHSAFFRKKKLGKNIFLTLRVPNPDRERSSGKALLEIMESIPRSFDVARQFYRQDIAPIFEIILPMTTNAPELNRIWNYYRNYVAGKSDRPVLPGDITFKEWIGEFSPKSINVIPLIEDKPSLIHAHLIVEQYLQGKDIPFQRVFLARSDPAMTYGSTSAVLLIKLALHKLHQLELKLGLPIYPIVGLGSAPFRGNFKPTNVKSRLNGYPSVQTFTVQSAFKFDYPEELVRKAIGIIRKSRRRAPVAIEDEAVLLGVIEKISATYSRQVEKLNAHINGMARFVPPRRKRKLHTGLFGYTRAVAGKRLPRAISFCSSLYSWGLPPELLGLADLKPSEIKYIIEHYPNFLADMSDAMTFFDPQCLSALPPRVADEIRHTVRLLKVEVGSNIIHQSLTRAMRNLLAKNDTQNLPDLITQAAKERRFLG